MVISFSRRRTLLIFCFSAFCGGIFLATLFSDFFLWISLFLVVVAASFFSPRVALFFLFALFLGGLRVFVAPFSPAETDVAHFAGEQIMLRGEFLRFPDRRFSREKWILEVSDMRKKETDLWHPATGRVLLTLSKGNDFSLGDRVSVSGKIEIPFETETFSYKNFLAKEGIFSTMSFASVSPLSSRAVFFFSPLFTLREWFDTRLQSRIPEPESAFAAGILVGDRQHFSPEKEEQFRRTGLSHMLALSGYNITILVLAVFFLFRIFPQNIRLVLTLLVVTLFVFFVGGGSNILRAALMGGIGIFVVSSGRRADGFSLLLLASVVLLLFSPYLLVYDPSFQLSVLGVLGILVFSPPLKSWCSSLRIPPFFADILVTTLAAQIGVFPLLIFLFGSISLVAPLANLLVAPFIPLGMLLSFLAVVVPSFFGQVAAFFAWMLLHFLLAIIALLASLPFAEIS